MSQFYEIFNIILRMMTKVKKKAKSRLKMKQPQTPPQNLSIPSSQFLRLPMVSLKVVVQKYFVTSVFKMIMLQKIVPRLD